MWVCMHAYIYLFIPVWMPSVIGWLFGIKTHLCESNDVWRSTGRPSVRSDEHDDERNLLYRLWNINTYIQRQWQVHTYTHTYNEEWSNRKSLIYLNTVIYPCIVISYTLNILIGLPYHAEVYILLCFSCFTLISTWRRSQSFI